MATLIQEAITHSPNMDAATTELAARLRASTVEIRNQDRGNGSGVIWREDGLIITNHHVAQSDTVEVVLHDGRTFKGTVTARNPDRDLAAVRVEATNLPAAPIGDSSALRVGELVLAMGNPLGLKGALTVGIIHAVANGGGRFIRADLSLMPGNSGGPMTDAHGRVIGINSMVAGELALAVPSNAVENFLSGGGKPAFLGVQSQAVQLPTGAAAFEGVTQETALLVLAVVEGGPAARNGLLQGDILLAAGTTALEGPDDLLGVLRECGAGTPLPLTIVRAGKRQEVTVILGEREAEAR
jgi:serine protease Do